MTPFSLPPASGPDARLVDTLLERLSRKEAIEATTASLKRLGQRAAPRLLAHLPNPARNRQTLVFYALQYCWSPLAEAPVSAFLAHPDPELRHMAAIVLVKGAGYERFAHYLTPLLAHPDEGIAAWALGHLEGERPDPQRTLALLAQPGFRHALAPHLPRYQGRAFIPHSRALLAAGSPREQGYAMAALLQQGAADAETRARVAERLHHPDPGLRELAAEYLTWHGQPGELPAVERALAGEADRHTRAAMAAAAERIRQRRETLPEDIMAAMAAPPPEASSAGDPAALADRIRGLLTRLRGEHPPRPEAWQQARALLAAEVMAPHLAWRGRNPPAEFIAPRQARLALLGWLTGTPWARGGWREEAAGPLSPPPPLTRLLPPVRDDWQQGEGNFGKETEQTAVRGFGGMVHVGEDLAWEQPHRTVVAVAEGVVRLVRCGPTWGHLVVVEHRTPGGEAFCSLYAHLGPFLLVAPGQRVAAGEKLGSVGRGFTWENGGYAPHLHFGLHHGPHEQVPLPGSLVDLRYRGVACVGRVVWADREWIEAEILWRGWPHRVRTATTWLAGYLTKTAWERGRHGWLDPRRVLSPAHRRA